MPRADVHCVFSVRVTSYAGRFTLAPLHSPLVSCLPTPRPPSPFPVPRPSSLDLRTLVHHPISHTAGTGSCLSTRARVRAENVTIRSARYRTSGKTRIRVHYYSRVLRGTKDIRKVHWDRQQRLACAVMKPFECSTHTHDVHCHG